MSELRDLYQELILDHTREPRNFGKLEVANRTARGVNPLCGDQLELYLLLEDGVVRDVRFEGRGCAIATASASLMTQAIKGRHVDEVARLFERFHEAVTTPPDQEIDISELGKLAALTGVREFPVRVKCASLAWHTLQVAMQGRDEIAVTE